MVAKVAQSAQSVKRINGFLSLDGAQNCGTGSKRRGLSAGLDFLAPRRLWDFFLSDLWRTGGFTVTTAESAWASKAWSVTASVPATGALSRLVRMSKEVTTEATFPLNVSSLDNGVYFIEVLGCSGGCQNGPCTFSIPD